MATLNVKSNDIKTHEGARASKRDPRWELFVTLACSLNENSFYETADETRFRVERLAKEVVTGDEDASFSLNLVSWLRGPGGLRTAASVAAMALVHARLEAGLVGRNRDLVRAAIRRLDEAPAFLAGYKAAYGAKRTDDGDRTKAKVPEPVKRGVADALSDLMTEYSYLKWRGKAAHGGVSLADAIRLVHPKPKDDTQSALFALACGHTTDLEALPMVAERAAFDELERSEKIGFAMAAGDVTARMRAAGLTHEALMSSLGKLSQPDAETVWANLIPTMGYQALLMNARRIALATWPAAAAEERERQTRFRAWWGNDDGDGASSLSLDDAPVPVQMLVERLSHPERADYEPLPVAFVSAYRNVPAVLRRVVAEAAPYACRHVPVLPGRTLVMLDASGSMTAPMSQRSSATRHDVASFFAAALLCASRVTEGMHVDVVSFGDRLLSRVSTDGVWLADGDIDPLSVANAMTRPGGGTDIFGCLHEALGKAVAPYDRVIVITDEQTGPTGNFRWYSGREFSYINVTGVLADSTSKDAHAFVWNVAGYAPTVVDGNVVTLSGLTDAAFAVLAADAGSAFPWEA